MNPSNTSQRLQEIRELLSKKNCSENLLKSKRNGNHVLLLENDARMEANKDARICVFRILKAPFHIYTLERALFNDLFEVDNSDEAINDLINWFNYNKENEERNKGG